MPFIGFLLFIKLVIILGFFTLRFIYKYSKTREVVYLKKLGLVWTLPGIFVGFVLYAHFPITKERVIGYYQVDSNFYPGENAEWQKAHFSFEITQANEFLFHEKLKDGSIRTSRGKVEWYSQSPPMLYRITMEQSHPLIDAYPALYRGNRQFYYVFETKFGNMFYRKVR